MARYWSYGLLKCLMIYNADVPDYFQLIIYLDKRLLPEIPGFFLWSAKRGSSLLHLTGIKWGRGKKSLSTTSEQDDTYPWVANPFQFVGCLWATVPTVSSNCWSFPSSLSGRWCTCLGGVSESSEAGMRYLFTTSIFPCGVFLLEEHVQKSSLFSVFTAVQSVDDWLCQ